VPPRPAISTAETGESGSSHVLDADDQVALHEFEAGFDSNFW